MNFLNARLCAYLRTLSSFGSSFVSGSGIGGSIFLKFASINVISSPESIDKRKFIVDTRYNHALLEGFYSILPPHFLFIALEKVMRLGTYMVDLNPKRNTKLFSEAFIDKENIRAFTNT